MMPLGELFRLAAPRAWIDIRDRLRERPRMSTDVLCGILPLAIRIVLRRTRDLRAMRFGAFVVSMRIFHADHDRASVRGMIVRLDRHDRSPSGNIHLHAMVADAQPHPEPECIAQ